MTPNCARRHEWSRSAAGGAAGLAPAAAWRLGAAPAGGFGVMSCCCPRTAAWAPARRGASGRAWASRERAHRSGRPGLSWCCSNAARSWGLSERSVCVRLAIACCMVSSCLAVPGSLAARSLDLLIIDTTLVQSAASEASTPQASLAGSASQVRGLLTAGSAAWDSLGSNHSSSAARRRQYAGTGCGTQRLQHDQPPSGSAHLRAVMACGPAATSGSPAAAGARPPRRRRCRCRQR